MMTLHFLIRRTHSSSSLSVMSLLCLPTISLQILGRKSNQNFPNPRFSLRNFSLSSSTPSLCHLHHHHTTFPNSKSKNLTSYFSAVSLLLLLHYVIFIIITPRFQTQNPKTSPLTSPLQNKTQSSKYEISKIRLIAQNVPWTSTPEDIRSLFKKYGNVIDIKMSMHKKERNRGLVFIEMASPEEASIALKSLESYEYEGRHLKVDYVKTKKKKTYPPQEKPMPVPTFDLFVANLAFEARAKHLKEFFYADLGNVVSTEVMFHENPRKSSGYGFVSFKTKKQAEAALIEFQGKDFMGRPIRLARSKQFVKLQAKEGLQPQDEEEGEPSQSETVTQEEETPAAEN